MPKTHHVLQLYTVSQDILETVLPTWRYILGALGTVVGKRVAGHSFVRDERSRGPGMEFKS